MKTERIKSLVRSPWRRGLHLSTLALSVACFAISPQAGAVCQDGCNDNGNVFLGDDAFLNRTGHFDTAIGDAALRFETFGQSNTANGAYALYNNTGTFAVNFNVANGANALYGNTAGGFQNTANGANALHSNTTGSTNVADGYSALFYNTTGVGNTAIGFQALYQNTGSNNIGLGFNAGSNLTNGGGNVCIGYNVVGVAGESNTTRISNIYYSNASVRPVYANSDNKIGALVSSSRFKEQIQPMDEASEAILSLKPVSFHYKKDIEPNGAIMFGLIAEDVAKVDPDLVTRDNNGEPETVRYDAVNAMLLNEFLKEHRKVEQQGGRIEERDRVITQRATEIRALTSQLQKVSEKLELIKSTPRIVTNH
jgi:Chaperone of endosialidase